MRIVLLGHEDIASLYALDRLVKRCPAHAYTLFWSGPMAGQKAAAPELERLAASDRALFSRYLEHPDTASLFRDAEALSAPNSPEGVARLAGAGPDLVVSIRYRRILKPEAIAVPRFGVLNLHSGILPDYRGVMATFWAMLAGEPEIGTTLHRIVDAGIDTGPVIAIQRRKTDYKGSYLSNVLALYADGCERIAQAIDEIDRNGTVKTAGQPAGEGAYFGPPTETDALKFLKTGLKLVDDDEECTFRTIVRS